MIKINDVFIKRVRREPVPRKLVLYLYPAYRYLFYAFVVIDTLVLGIIAIVLSFFDSSGNIGCNLGKLWSRINLFLSGVRVSVKGLDNLDPNQSYIVMSNHQSYYDVFAIMASLPLQMRWVMKSELRKIPFFGFACERIGTISIDRGESAKARQTLNAAIEKIKAGASIVIFPEGTRSTDNNLLPFKKGGFVLAIASAVPILPVSVRGGKDIMPKGAGLKMRPGFMEVVVHKPVSTREYSLETKEQLMERVRDIIQSGVIDVGEGQGDKKATANKPSPW